MPYALILFGAVLLVAGIRNTYKDLWALVKNDFTAQNGFLTWVAVIAVVGGIGYIPRLKPLSIAFMTLLLLVLLISHQGVFAQLQNFIQSGAGGRNVAPGNQSSDLTPLVPLPGTASDEAQIAQNLTSIA